MPRDPIERLEFVALRPTKLCQRLSGRVTALML